MRKNSVSKLVKNKKASEFVEALLTFPMLIMIVFSIAYGVIYFNAKSNVEKIGTYFTRTLTTAQQYCAYSKDGQGSLSFNEEKTKNGEYARNLITNSNIFDGVTTKCYLALETYKTKVDENNNSILEKETYYDFFGFTASYNNMMGSIDPENVGPAKIADNWKIGNFINLNITSSVFSTQGGITLFELVTSINFFGGMHKVEIIGSTTTVNIKFQIENDICDDINLEDGEKPSVCIDE